MRMNIPDDMFPINKYDRFTLIGVIDHEKLVEPVYWSESVASRLPAELVCEICTVARKETPPSFDWQRYPAFGVDFEGFDIRSDSPFAQIDKSLLTRVLTGLFLMRSGRTDPGSLDTTIPCKKRQWNEEAIRGWLRRWSVNS